MSGDGYRNLDCNWLGLVYSEEVNVKAVVLYRVELELVNDCGVSLTVVKGKVNDVRHRSLDKTLEFLLFYGEKYVLHSETIEVARYEALCAECLDYGLVANLANLAVKCEMLHCVFVLKCVTHPGTGPGPIAPKAAAFQMRAQI